jgi:hypothetical protein
MVFHFCPVNASDIVIENFTVDDREDSVLSHFAAHIPDIISEKLLSSGLKTQRAESGSQIKQEKSQAWRISGSIHREGMNIIVVVRAKNDLGDEFDNQESISSEDLDLSLATENLASKIYAIFEDSFLFHVTIKSEPDSARLVLDGASSGYTPAELLLFKGDKEITLEKSGYHTLKHGISVTGDQEYKFDLIKYVPVSKTKRLMRKISLYSAAAATLAATGAVVMNLSSKRKYENAGEGADFNALYSDWEQKNLLMNISLGISATLWTLTGISFIIK